MTGVSGEWRRISGNHLDRIQRFFFFFFLKKENNKTSYKEENELLEKRDSNFHQWNDVFSFFLSSFDFVFVYLEATLAKEAGETTLKQTT